MCDNAGDAAFSSAGGHFNPDSRRHGLSSPDGPHAGDMPNVEIRSNGTAETTIRSDRLTSTDGPRTVFDADGSALVIHALADDQVTDPSGNSGARIACGVVGR